MNGNPLELFKQVLPDRIRPNGKGWRTNCPACDDRKGALSFTEGDDGRLLIYCFKGCSAEEVLVAVGLRLADVYPVRGWPASPEEKRRARKAIRESGWAVALDTLALEACVVQAAARQIAAAKPLNDDDDARLSVAVERVCQAKEVLCAR